MKKKWLNRAFRDKTSGGRPKTFFCFIAMLLLCVLSPAAVSAQGSGGISIDRQNVPFEEIVRHIESQTDYTFMYSTETARAIGRVTVSVANADIRRALDAVLAGKPYTYQIDGNVVILSLRPQAGQQGQQTTRVRGLVTDAEGRPMIGAAVIVKGTTVGTSTDAAGRFEVNVPAGRNILVFSFIGWTTQEVDIAGRTELRVTMAEDAQAVEEVVVTGMFTKSRESYTGATVTMTDKELKAAGNSNLLTAIRNIDPSFNIMDNVEYGSDPNRLPEITMRGRTNMDFNVRDLQAESSGLRSSNIPLFILDGFEISLERVMDMDNELIQSITLLKDASATALYGARGANGIVVITSKRPEPGALRISYRGTINIEAPDFSSYNLMDSREKLEYELAAGLYNHYLGFNSTIDQLLKEKYNERLIDVERGVDTYWLKYPARTGVGNRHSVRVDGGAENFQYAGSVSYNNIAGVMKKSSRNTLSGNLVFQYDYKNLKFQNDLTISHNKSYNSPYGSFSDYSSASPLYKPYDEEGKLKKMLSDEHVHLLYPYPPRVGNPLYNASLPYRDDSQYTNIQNNFAVEWHINPELFIRGRFGFTKQDSRSDKYVSRDHTSFDTDYYTGENYKSRGSYTYGTGNSFDYEADLTLNYNKTFGGVHQLYAGFSYQFEEKKSETFSVIAMGFSATNKDNIGLAAGYPANGKPTTSEQHARRLGATLNVNYTYDRRYFADVSGKLEGSSKFGANERTAPFWSAGFGWNVHNEDFFTSSRAVNSLRFRLSYGTSGSQDFSSYQALTTYRYFSQETLKHWTGAYMMGMGNPDLTWQKTKQLNVGLETLLFDSRLRLNVDYYNKLTDALITDINIPTASGFGSYKANVGEVRNRGLEVTANVFILRNTETGLTWSVGGSLVHNQNKILKISNSLEFLNKELLEYAGPNPSFLYEEGQSMNTIFVVRSLGIDPATGKEIFLDREGNRTDAWNAQDKMACGINEPKLWGNFRTMLRWKNLTLNAVFSYRTGGYTYNQTLVDKVENINRTQAWANLDRRALYDRWQNAGDQSMYKDIRDFNETRASSRFVMKENSFRLNSVNLDYEFGAEWLRRNLQISYLTIGLYAEDVFNISSVREERGLSYPFSRKYSISISARF